MTSGETEGPDTLLAVPGNPLGLRGPFPPLENLYFHVSLPDLQHSQVRKAYRFWSQINVGLSPAPLFTSAANMGEPLEGLLILVTHLQNEPITGGSRPLDSAEYRLPN